MKNSYTQIYTFNIKNILDNYVIEIKTNDIYSLFISNKKLMKSILTSFAKNQSFIFKLFLFILSTVLINLFIAKGRAV